MPLPFLARLLGGAPPPPPLPCPPHAPALVTAASWTMIAAALATWLALTFAVPPAPYGRHGRTNPANAARYGRGLPARAAWALQELPAFLIPLALAVHAAKVTGSGFTGLTAALGPQKTVLLGAFLAHYAHRALIFPLRIRGGARTPLGIAALAFLFCTLNGTLQGAALVWCGRESAVVPPALFKGGMGAMAAGGALNLAADGALRRLRSGAASSSSTAAGAYKLPAGPLFALVACPNYSGEALEWAGWAAASGFSLPATAFALYTLANLGPRARAHNAWYRARFPGGFEGRAGMVPWVY